MGWLDIQKKHKIYFEIPRAWLLIPSQSHQRSRKHPHRVSQRLSHLTVQRKLLVAPLNYCNVDSQDYFAQNAPFSN